PAPSGRSRPQCQTPASRPGLDPLLLAFGPRSVLFAFLAADAAQHHCRVGHIERRLRVFHGLLRRCVTVDFSHQRENRVFDLDFHWVLTPIWRAVKGSAPIPVQSAAFSYCWSNAAFDIGKMSPSGPVTSIPSPRQNGLMPFSVGTM